MNIKADPALFESKLAVLTNCWIIERETTKRDCLRLMNTRKQLALCIPNGNSSMAPCSGRGFKQFGNCVFLRLRPPDALNLK